MLKHITDWLKWRKAKRLVRKGQSPIMAMIDSGLFEKKINSPRWWEEVHQERIDGDWLHIGVNIDNGEEIWHNMATGESECREPRHA